MREKFDAGGFRHYIANRNVLAVSAKPFCESLPRGTLLSNSPVCETCAKNSKEEGIQIAREKQPVLILLNFHLPAMKGIEAIKVLRADTTTSSILVIAVTASPMPEDRPKRLAAGFDGMQTKPFHLIPFMQTEEQVLMRSVNAVKRTRMNRRSWPQATLKRSI